MKDYMDAALSENDLPATKGDVNALAISTKADMAVLKVDLAELEERTNLRFDAMLELIKTTAQETRNHFDVVAENIHEDVASVNLDDIASLRDRVDNHEERLKALEPSF